MSQTHSSHRTAQLLEEVLGFVGQSQGLTSAMFDDGRVSITQQVDGKKVLFWSESLSEVVSRFDSDGKPFIQINFSTGLKILLTDTLVGFKPDQMEGLDMSKLPRVVTTPDLLSVLEAIEETLGGDGSQDHEIEILKRVYQSILSGAEKAGFNLPFERAWMIRIFPSNLRASA